MIKPRDMKFAPKKRRCLGAALTTNKDKECPECDGKGKVMRAVIRRELGLWPIECPKCNGTRKVKDE